MSGMPLDYLLSSFGRRADVTLPLTWFTLLVSVAVCLIVGALLMLGLRHAQVGGADETSAEPVSRDQAGDLRWITIGLLITMIPLLATLIWTMAALAHVAGPPRRSALTIDVIAHQWWWEAQYPGTEPTDGFITANEIHIPVGVPVVIRLHGGDVIHSFWVPQLAGKTDAIPGQQNITWLEADRPGVFRGQCAEYCGAEHAKMGFEVVAQSMADFQRWRLTQLQGAMPPGTPAQQRGYALTIGQCGRCHAIRGTAASARTGPDLTHLMSRRTLAAAMLINNPGSLAGWIEDPQSAKPGALMPAQPLSGPQLNDVTTYLETLK